MSENELTDMKSAAAASKSRGLFYGWIIVAASFPVVAISYGSLYSFGVFLLPFREYFGASSAAISGAYSTAVLMYMAFGIPAGWLADKYNPRVTTIAGLLLMAVGLVLTSRVTTIWQLYLTYALIGAGMSPAYSPLMTTISRWFVKRRGLALGILTAGVGAGPLIMAPVATHLILTNDWRFALMVIAGGTIVVIPAAFLMKKTPAEIGRLPDGGIIDTTPALQPQVATAVSGKASGLSLKGAIRTRGFWQMAIIYFMIGLSLQMVLAHVAAYSQGKGISPITAAAVLSTISGVSIAGRMTMGLASDWIGRRRALAICVFMEGLLVLWLITASSVWMFFLFAIVFGFFYGGHVPQLPALVGETLGLEHMGTVLGATSFFWGVGGAIGPYLAGYIVDTTGSYAWAFAVGGLGMLLITATSLVVKKAVA